MKSNRRPYVLVAIILSAPFWLFIVGDISQVASQDSIYSEAPMLAERVANGELRPVDERLPINPMLLQPIERVGGYGGTLEVPVTIPQNSSLVSQTIGYESLLRWDAQWLRVIPNIAQSYDVSSDATTYTFHLREGIRWSDGTPFNADDIMFWYEDVFSNPELTPRAANWLSIDGMPVRVEKIDHVTVMFSFAGPNSFFPSDIANTLGTAPVSYPRHYMQHFHAEYNADIDNMLAEAGLETWVELFNSKIDVRNTDLPRLGAWTVVDNQPDQVVAERNPYYWKIDSDFNQLPYIDRVVFTSVTTDDEFEMVVSNENAHLLLLSEFENLALSDKSTRDLHSVTLISSYSSDLVLVLNLNHPDPALRAFFQNRDVRIALSHAINRPRIVDEVFEGQSQAYQVAPRPESGAFQFGGKKR